jgi:hypothetical protein
VFIADSATPAIQNPAPFCFFFPAFTIPAIERIKPAIEPDNDTTNDTINKENKTADSLSLNMLKR